jgi:23S rRNA (guanosine2251-2'-O)-methyltransferase
MIKNNQEYIIYGFHAVAHILRYAPHRARKIFMARSKDLEELETLALKAGIACEYVDRDFLKRRFGVDKEAQGLILSCTPFIYSPLEEFFLQDAHTLVILDNWQDAVNIGRAARAALCFGASGLVICTDRCAQINSAAEKAAVGALARLPVARVGNLASALRKIKEQGFFVYGADERGTENLMTCDFSSKKAIVIGQEGAGLRDLTKKTCDVLVSIPMVNTDICLNAADSALLFLYEIYKRGE